MKVLHLEPKLCSKTMVGAAKLLAMTRSVTAQVAQVEQVKKVGETAGAVTSKKDRVFSIVLLNFLVNYFVTNEFRADFL
ncbi:hypothetical protein MTO96_008514 [Rhipicephalus appendiculatus]